jgi:hypothetical protein
MAVWKLLEWLHEDRKITETNTYIILYHS